MRLSTKELLTSSRNCSKIKNTKIINPRKITRQKTINITKNTSIIKKQILSSHKENPFTKPNLNTNENNQFKRKMARRYTNTIIPRANFNSLLRSNKVLLKDSFFNNNLYSTEIYSNKCIEDKKIEKKNDINDNFNENDIDKLCDYFKQSNLKQTVIIDKKGNNNLDVPQNYFTTDYNYKNSIKKINVKEKKRIPINKKFVSSTHVILNRKNILHKIDILDNNNNNSSKANNKLKSLKAKKSIKKIKTIIHKKLLSTKDIVPQKYFKIIKNEKEKDEQIISEKNSIFEESTNKSMDSSFMNSSFNDFFNH